jgi:DNA-binding transcriptional LysR family regulator
LRHSIEELTAFVAVVELNSFSAAAVRLSITQPALSRRIAKIEEVVGEQLLVRNKKNIVPNETGQRFYVIAKRLVIEVQTAAVELQNIREDDSGRVSMSINMTWCSLLIADITAEFRKHYPNYTLNIFEGSSVFAVKKVYDGEVDLGVTQKPKRLFGVEFDPLETDEFRVACHRDHPLASFAAIPADELKNHVWMRLIRDSVFASLDYIEFEGGTDFPETLVNANHYSTILRMVDANVGVTILPRMALHQFEGQNVVLRPFVDPMVRRTVGLLTKQNRAMTPASIKLSQIIRDQFSKRSRS